MKSDSFLDFQKRGYRLSNITERWSVASHIMSLIAFVHKIAYMRFRFYPLCLDNLPPSVLHHKATTTQCRRYTTECAKVHKVHISARQDWVELCQTRRPIKKKESEKCERGLDGSSRAVDTTDPAEHNRSSVPPVSRHKLFSTCLRDKRREREHPEGNKNRHTREVTTTATMYRQQRVRREAPIKREVHLLLA